MSKRLIGRHTSVIIILAICERSADDQLVVTKDKEVINDTDEQRAGSSYHTHTHSCRNTKPYKSIIQERKYKYKKGKNELNERMNSLH